jgi:hypothetical protein
MKVIKLLLAFAIVAPMLVASDDRVVARKDGTQQTKRGRKASRKTESSDRQRMRRATWSESFLNNTETSSGGTTSGNRVPPPSLSPSETSWWPNFYGSRPGNNRPSNSEELPSRVPPTKPPSREKPGTKVRPANQSPDLAVNATTNGRSLNLAPFRALLIVLFPLVFLLANLVECISTIPVCGKIQSC